MCVCGAKYECKSMAQNKMNDYLSGKGIPLAQNGFSGSMSLSTRITIMVFLSCSDLVRVCAPTCNSGWGEGDDEDGAAIASVIMLSNHYSSELDSILRFKSTRPPTSTHYPTFYDFVSYSRLNTKITTSKYQSLQ